MESAAIESAALAGSVARDLSVWGLFLQADFVVKLVMLALVLASFWCWAIIFEKIMRIRRLQADAADFEATFWSGGSLDELYDDMGGRPADPMSSIFTAAMREWRRSSERGTIGSDQRGGLGQRLDRVMQITLGREMEHLERYMPFLASVGSTAPFVGLFGTVWGIMNRDRKSVV